MRIIAGMLRKARGPTLCLPNEALIAHQQAPQGRWPCLIHLAGGMVVVVVVVVVDVELVGSLGLSPVASLARALV